MGAGGVKILAWGFVMAPHLLLALVNFFFNSLKNMGLFVNFWPSLFTIHYFLADYSLFIIKKRHYSLIIIPHPDPHTGIARALNEKCL